MTASVATCEALLEIEGQMLATGAAWGEAGTLAHLHTHSVSHCQFMFQTLQQLVRVVLYLGCKSQKAVHRSKEVCSVHLLSPSPFPHPAQTPKGKWAPSSVSNT